jgi:hypothetical protein
MLLCDFTRQSLMTEVYMSSRRSVKRHWHFEHCLQSLCHVVFHTVKSHKDRVVIVSHELICMIHGLVITIHLEDELDSGGS